VLAVLEETGLDQNTVVVFTSDNGGSLPHAQNNDPWRGGLRVPFILRWPAQIKAGARSDYAGLNFDLFPTFLELAGGEPSPGLDAVSLAPCSKATASPRSATSISSAGRWRGLRRQELRSHHPRRLEADAERPVQPAGTLQPQGRPEGEEQPRRHAVEGAQRTLHRAAETDPARRLGALAAALKRTWIKAVTSRSYGLSAKFGIKLFRVLAGMPPFSRCRVPLSVMSMVT
jgi:arylsulfatase A-like enzyme